MLRGCRAKLNLTLNDFAYYILNVLLLTICGQRKIAMLADQFWAGHEGFADKGDRLASAGAAVLPRSAARLLLEHGRADWIQTRWSQRHLLQRINSTRRPQNCHGN